MEIPVYAVAERERRSADAIQVVEAPMEPGSAKMIQEFD